MKGAIHRSLNNAIYKMPIPGQYVFHDMDSEEYYAFRTAESPDKLNLKRRDIVHIVTDGDPRNKRALMRDGVQHTLMNYTMLELREIAPHLLQPNQSELVAMEIIASKGREHISLTTLNSNRKQKMVIIGRAYREEFNLQFSKM